MTKLALGVLMFAMQREMGIVMIEVGILPAALIVARRAFFAQLASMPLRLIVLLVTGDAFVR